MFASRLPPLLRRAGAGYFEEDVAQGSPCEQRAGDDADRIGHHVGAFHRPRRGEPRLRQEAKQLTLPEAMGERFQAMGFARDVEFGAAFLVGDLSWRL